MRVFIVLALFAVVNADVGGYTYGIAPDGGYIAGGSNGDQSIRGEGISGVNGGPDGGIFDGSFIGQARGSVGIFAAPSSDSFRNSFGGSAGGSLAAPSSDSFRGSLGTTVGGSFAAPSSDSFQNSFGGSADGSLAAPSSDSFRGSLGTTVGGSFAAPSSDSFRNSFVSSAGGSLAAPSGDSLRDSLGSSAAGYFAAPSSDSFQNSFGGSADGSLAAPSSDSFRGSLGSSAGGSLTAPSSDSFRGSLAGSALRDFDAGFGAASNTAPLIDNGFNKEFFTFSAPESEFEASTPIGEVSQSFKKNLRVIFIRGPEHHGINHAAINLAKQAAEEKTEIYLLTKQPDVSELANRLQQINNNIKSKPEVHFVKYRTPEDAANAQHAIQQQYDNIGGSSHAHDDDVADVLNFASKGSTHSAFSGNDAGSFGAATSNSYLPPASHVDSSSSPSSTYLPIAKL